MSDLTRKNWLKTWPLSISPRAKGLRDDFSAGFDNSPLSLTDVCDENGMFVESKLDLNEILATPKLSSPPSRQSSKQCHEASETSQRLPFESQLEDIKKAISPVTPILHSSSSTKSPIMPNETPVLVQGKNGSLGDFTRRFKRSPKSPTPQSSPFTTRESPPGAVKSESDSNKRALSDIRVKHGLPPTTRLSRINVDPLHPHHPFDWNTKNLWCMNCATAGIRPISTIYPSSTTHKEANESFAKNSLSSSVPHSPTKFLMQDNLREIPAKCSICQCACCIYGEKKLVIFETDRKLLDISSLNTKQRGAIMRLRREAIKDICEIQDSWMCGRDPSTFVQCMGCECQKLVCTSCAARCGDPLCGLIFCRLCWPTQTGYCPLHDLSADPDVGNQIVDPSHQGTHQQDYPDNREVSRR